MAGNWFDAGRRELLEPGARVGAYTIAGVLGAGSMGAVYRATDDGGAEVALKILHRDFDADPVARELMAAEVAALQRLRHPNVALVLDAELDASEAFVVTELIPGKPLDKEIAEGGPLDATDLAELAEQLGAALLELETAGVVHRDIKPSNIIVSPCGPVLIDFGIAADVPATDDAAGLATPGGGIAAGRVAAGGQAGAGVIGGGAIGSGVVDNGGAPGFAAGVVANGGAPGFAARGVGQGSGAVAQSVRIMGTPGYLAPELLGGAAPTAASDWWSWAAVLAYAATGRPPFGHGAADDVFNRELQGRVDLVGLPPRTAAALLSALSPDPANRMPPAEVTKALRRDAAAPRHSAAGVAVAQNPETVMMQGHPTAVMPPIRHSAQGALATPSQNLENPVMHGNPTMVLSPLVEATRVMPPLQPQAMVYPQAAVPPQPTVPPPAFGQHPTLAVMASAAPQGYKFYQRPVVPKRPGVLWALAVPLVLLAARAPIMAFAIFAPLVVVCRIVGTFVDDLHLRRELAGEPRANDAAIVAARSPFTLVRGVVGSFPQLLVGLGVALLVMAAGWWATGANGPVPLTERWVHPAILAFAMLCALLLTWFGTHSFLTRYGAREVLQTIAPGGIGLVFVLVGIALSAYLLYTVLIAPGQINWWPGVAPPLL